MSDRQNVALNYVNSNPGCAAKDVAEAIEPGSDARGAGQTLRALTRAALISKDGTSYRITQKGIDHIES